MSHTCVPPILNTVIILSTLNTLGYSWTPSLPPPELFDTVVSSRRGFGTLEMYVAPSHGLMLHG